VRVEEAETPFSRACRQGDLLRLPIKHGEGCFVAEEHVLRNLEENRQVVLRYVDTAGRVTDGANPNGSLNNIAGIVNATRNVFGMMPHPEYACESAIGGEDGSRLFRSVRTTTTAGSSVASASVPPGL
jgi:phosphoribosylformylglycinamidine synthase